MSTPDKVLDTATCPKCEADVRPDSVFCYNCGGRVSEDDEIVEPAPEATATEKKPAPGLRTARDIKRRERVFQRRPKEVVWEPSIDGPDTLLLVLSLITVVFTIVVIFLVFYLR